MDMISMVFNILFREKKANINLFNNKTTDFHVILSFFFAMQHFVIVDEAT